MCGEKSRGLSVRYLPRGSPPRVRGKVVVVPLVVVPVGITPACAGKSAKSASFAIFRRDHPRVCGEKKKPTLITGLKIGSPPRVRGKVRPAAAPNGPIGITPACAGKSGNCHVHIEQDGDHPRVCGEKIYLYHRFTPFLGSPPRVRGKVVKEVTGQTATRITPACAGKSSGCFRSCL